MTAQLWDIPLYFFIYAIIGWCAEVVYHAVTTGTYENRGMLAGTYCPIYGFGCVILISFLSEFKGNDWFIFLGAGMLCSLLELVAGYVLNKLFRTRWWDYTHRPFNIGGYICLQFGLMWGFGGLLMMNTIHPLIQGFVHWLPHMVVVATVVIMGQIMVCDTAYTVVSILKLNREFEVLEKLHADLYAFSSDVAQDLTKKTLDADKKAKRFQAESEQKIAQAKARYEGRKKQLGKAQRRLLKAFPTMVSQKHDDILKRLREELKL